MIDKLLTYKENQNEIFNDNEMHLMGFVKWLENKGLSSKTIKTHVANVEFYINDYLGCDLLDVTKGCYKIDRFLGDWFIRMVTLTENRARKKQGFNISAQ